MRLREGTKRVAVIAALSASAFAVLAATGTFSPFSALPSWATQYCSQYHPQYQYGGSCSPLVPPLIAFQSTREGGGNTEVYVMNPDGSAQTRLWTNDGAVFDGLPSFSPTGSKVAFQSQRDGISEIYTMNLDGSIQARLTPTSSQNTQPSWSPDGLRIAFISNRAGFSNVYTMY